MLRIVVFAVIGAFCAHFFNIHWAAGTLIGAGLGWLSYGLA